MDKQLRLFFIKSIIVLGFIHLAYLIYGYFKFVGIRKIYMYTEFYRFKFYDDVSISHFFVSGLFLLFFIVFLLRNHSANKHSVSSGMQIGASLLLISFLSLTFFMSYSFGLNAKLRHELPENSLNRDKALLNTLTPMLYPPGAYSLDEVFKPENILYPKPYPVVSEIDTSYYDPNDSSYYTTAVNYYSIDTLTVLSSNFKNISAKMLEGMVSIGIDSSEFTKRIISKEVIGDSTKVIFKGVAVHPDDDEDICVFLKSKNLYRPIHGVPVATQQYQSAVTRYQLLYKYPQDSLLRSFQQLDTLFKKYGVESQLVPKNLAQDVFNYRDHSREPLQQLRNDFDRNKLKEKFNTLERLFYQPNFLHPSIQLIFIIVVLSVWFGLLLMYLIWNYFKWRKLSVTSNA